MVAIDGGTLRRSFDKAALRSPRQGVIAFASGVRVVIGQSVIVRGEITEGVKHATKQMPIP